MIEKYELENFTPKKINSIRKKYLKKCKKEVNLNAQNTKNKEVKNNE